MHILDRPTGRSARRIWAVLLAGVASGCAEAPYRLTADRPTLIADGRDRTLVRLQPRHWLDVRTWAHRPSLELLRHPEGVRLSNVDGGRWLLSAGRAEGRVELTSDNATLAIDIEPANDDDDRDGLPDAIELRSEGDRAAFTAWFTAIAEAQFHRLDDRWAAVHRDCAGLVRFAFREALRPHDPAWWSRSRWVHSGTHADVAGLAYPNLPIVGDRPFRRRHGRFVRTLGIDAQFTAAPSARTLWQHNTDLVSRNIGTARAGDLLFFRTHSATGSGMHTMIALGRRPGATHREAAHRVVYHTGPTPHDDGEVRRVTIDALLRHPEPGWRPVPHNQRFLGVHRLRHLTAPIGHAWAGSMRSLP